MNDIETYRLRDGDKINNLPDDTQGDISVIENDISAIEVEQETQNNNISNNTTEVGKRLKNKANSGKYLEDVIESGNITIDKTDPYNPIIGVIPGTGLGDMQKLTYDPADISEQLVGETATQTISNKTLDNTSSVGFNTAAGVIVGEGEIAWNDEDGTLDVGMKGGNVTGQMFEELFIYAKASEAITNGDVVYKSGVVGGSAKLEISKYIADGTIDPILVLGIATEDIAIGEFGFVTTFGKIRGLDTSAYAEDTILYASPTTAGAYTDIEPTAPNIKAPIALVTYSHVINGVLSTERIYIPKIEDLNGVQITSPTTGQSMIYDGTKWVNGTLSASNVSNTPAGNISATTVQGAINELDTEKEPAITKNTAFNKNFGTTAGTVLEGSKDALYAKLASANVFTSINSFNNFLNLGNSIGSFSPITQSRIYGSSNGGGSYPYNENGHLVLQPRTGGVNQDIVMNVGSGASANFVAMMVEGNTGNVGIGTTNPQAKLDVNGNIKQNGQTVGEPDFYKYRIVTSVSSGNLTVALKNYLGDDPSVTVPVKVQIGGVVRTITSALSLAHNSGTNWFNLGSAELAGKECDIFVFLYIGSSSGNVELATGRVPSIYKGSDTVNNNDTNEKALQETGAYDDNTLFTNIGRFNATLSASPFNWSIPATSVILNVRTLETRLLDYNIVLTGFSTVTQGATNNKYRISGSKLELYLNNNIGGTSNATTLSFTIPFSYNGTLNARDGLLPVFVKDNGSNQSVLGHYYVSSTGDNTSIKVGKSFYNGAWTASGDKQIYTSEFTYNI